MKKIFILGLNSFSGSYFADYALNKGYIVFGCYRTPKKNFLLPYEIGIKKIKKYKINFDSNNDINKLIKILIKIKPDYIVDFASVCHVDESWKYPEKYFKSNVSSKIKIFNKQFTFLKKLVYISTPEVFGNQKINLKEKSNKYIPSTPYAISKLACEYYLKSKIQKNKLPLIVCRFSNFYGIGQPVYRLIPKIIYYLNKGYKFPVDGKGDSKRNYIHGEDFSDGILKALQKGNIGKTYHFAGKKLYSVLEIIKIICKYKKTNYKNFITFKVDRKAKDYAYNLSTMNSRKELKWRQKYNFKNSLKSIIDFYDLTQPKISSNDFKKFI